MRSTRQRRAFAGTSARCSYSRSGCRMPTRSLPPSRRSSDGWAPSPLLSARSRAPASTGSFDPPARESPHHSGRRLHGTKHCLTSTRSPSSSMHCPGWSRPRRRERAVLRSSMEPAPRTSSASYEQPRCATGVGLGSHWVGFRQAISSITPSRTASSEHALWGRRWSQPMGYGRRNSLQPWPGRCWEPDASWPAWRSRAGRTPTTCAPTGRRAPTGGTFGVHRTGAQRSCRRFQPNHHHRSRLPQPRRAAGGRACRR